MASGLLSFGGRAALMALGRSAVLFTPVGAAGRGSGKALTAGLLELLLGPPRGRGLPLGWPGRGSGAFGNSAFVASMCHARFRCHRAAARRRCAS